MGDARIDALFTMINFRTPTPDVFGAIPCAWLCAIAIAACAGVSRPCAAQLRIMNYNIAQLQGDHVDLQNVLLAAHDDDKPGFAVPVGVLVFQEVLSGNVATLQSIVNAAAPPGVTYALATYTNTSEDDFGGAQAMFYRTDLLTEVASSHADIFTGAGRDADRWKLQLNGYASPAASFFVYSAHLKASLGYENERLTGAQAIRSNANALGAGNNIIYAGDWNLYVNTEPAYLHFLSSGNGQAFDPLGTGSWAGSGNAGKHTQSPRLNGTTALVGGGMDDRFDFQLSTATLHDALGLSLMDVPFAYRTFGNDAAHYNTSINTGNNSYYPGQTARSNALAAALFDASDHIPVIVDYQIPAMLAATMPGTFGRVIQGATHALSANVTNPAPVEVALGADALEFTATGSLALSGVVNGTVEPLGDVDVVTLPLNTAVVGNATARMTLTSSSQAVQPATLTLNSTGTIVRHANASFAAASDVNTTSISATFEAGSGSHALPVAIHNFGFDSLQALLDVDSVNGLASPFSLTSGLTSGVGASPATLNFAFDTTGLTPGPHQAQVTIHVSDEDLPGAASSTLTLSFDVTVSGVPACASDVNDDAVVNVTDLLAVIGAWGACPTPPSVCAADVNADGFVNVTDLLAVIGAWGACP